MTDRPRWREVRDGEVLLPGTLPVEVDGRRMVLDLEADSDDDADDEEAEVEEGVCVGVDTAAETEAGGAAHAPGNGLDPAAAEAATLRSVAARLVRLPKLDRELQQKIERQRLGASVAEMKAALAEALEAEVEAAAREAQRAGSEQTAGSDFATTDRPEETLDEVVQRLAAMDGLDYATALGEAARRFKIPLSALEQAVQRKREPSPPPPGATGIVLPRSFRLDETGLWFTPLPSNRSPEPAPVFVCGPFKVLGEARDLESRAWGVAITWLDHDRRPHLWSCPQRLVHLDGNGIAAELADAGLSCGTSKEAHELLKGFFGALRTSHRLQSAERTGWHATSAHAGIVTHDAAVITPEESSWCPNN
jgi:hypothetical protein